MASAITLPQSDKAPTVRREVSLDYLRTTLVLFVLLAHSAMAYMVSAGDGFPNPLFPLVDNPRWIVCDLILRLADNFLIALMFFLSGLFVWPALQRHGIGRYIRGRLLRLGVPFAVTVTCLSPVAYYSSWRLAGHGGGLLAYWPKYILHLGWPTGPAWFIWLLLVFDIAVVVGLSPLSRIVPIVLKPLRKVSEYPVAAFCMMSVVLFAAYIPMVLRSGPEAWRVLFFPPLYFQTSRVFVNFVWFFTGVLIGSEGLTSPLLASDGALARQWRWWPIPGAILFAGLEIYSSRIPAHHSVRPETLVIQAILWVLSCTANCFAWLAFFRRHVTRRRRWMDSLTRSAYIIYLIHFVFVFWIQFILVQVIVPTPLKVMTTFLSATALSWLSAQLLLKVPGLSSIL